MANINITYAKAPNGKEILIVKDRVYQRWEEEGYDGFTPMDAEILEHTPIPPSWIVFGGRF